MPTGFRQLACGVRAYVDSLEALGLESLDLVLVLLEDLGSLKWLHSHFY